MIFIILTILFLFLIILLFCLYNKEKNKNKKIDLINEEVKKENEKICQENEQWLEKQRIFNSYFEQKQNELAKINKNIEDAENVSRRAFENYNDILDKEYLLKEKEYQEALDKMNSSYDKIQDKILAEISLIRAELDKISATRTAAIQAQLREKEIQEQSDFYSLSIDDIDKREARILHSIESELRDPRPIRMIIWQTYYSKKANELAARVLGPNEIIGIYKITNKQNGLCYIGQSKKIRERWREHMKCGLGIDTPANNSLYQDMQKIGIDNFTFELLESCSAQDLDEKECFYINLYDSKNYGYNNTIGNKKS